MQFLIFYLKDSHVQSHSFTVDSILELKKQIARYLSKKAENIKITKEGTELDDEYNFDNEVSEDINEMICKIRDNKQNTNINIELIQNNESSSIQYLTSLGYHRDAILSALEKSENDISQTLHLLTETSKPKLYSIGKTDSNHSTAGTSKENEQVSKEKIEGSLDVKLLISKVYELNYKWDQINQFFPNYSKGYLNFVLVYIHKKLSNKINEVQDSKWTDLEDKILLEQYYLGRSLQQLTEQLSPKSSKDIQLHLKNLDYSLKNTILLLQFAEQFNEEDCQWDIDDVNECQIPTFIDDLIEKFDKSKYLKNQEEYKKNFIEKIELLKQKSHSFNTYIPYKILPQKIIHPIPVDVSKRWNAIVDVKAVNFRDLDPDEFSEETERPSSSRAKSRISNSFKASNSEGDDESMSQNARSNESSSSNKVSDDVFEYSPASEQEDSQEVEETASSSNKKSNSKQKGSDKVVKKKYVWNKDDEATLIKRHDELGKSSDIWKKLSKELGYSAESCHRMYCRLTDTPLNGFTNQEMKLLIQKYNEYEKNETKWEDLAKVFPDRDLPTVRKQIIDAIRFIIREPKSNVYEKPHSILEMIGKKERCPWIEEFDQILMDIHNEIKEGPKLQDELLETFPNRTINGVFTHYKKLLVKIRQGKYKHKYLIL
ncbi:hypothetical protein TVAG_039030 [Trichomonas vaginalis G3]|uniref:UBA domain-containing protein n=1 Tax=Trichomonas vaginalis (strain ATCC PRA-98 / G3) TaxID=412133 RepID=A2E5L4_TRIV3|nr:hypothetical protein TVAGG3_0240110 [Trichomonas vaginalis G3]EAY12055.1 hypothetical protein TVAG_039030 [Trichomonas vaginalis G3]KAI5553261.1 hypothetical protein TVAGG3_0240110 [Trichomonas vaginalis G3]|eukprot:XP_001324278.1 hypothetical protein [Trichomonas vaginalis G3]